MITLFSSPSCTSCRKARTWFENHGIEYEERNILSRPIRKEELKNILTLSTEGTEEIISTRSRVFRELDIDIDALTISELLELTQKYPALIRRPILMDEKRIQIGFNEDEIRAFLPKKVRKIELQYAKMEAGIF
jgi:regulatory protein spx